MFTEDAAELLTESGLTVTADDLVLAMIAQSVSERICNETNQKTVPPGLRYLAAEIAAGEYLFRMKNAGQLEGFNYDAAVSAIKEGDTSVTFAVSEDTTEEGRLNALISHLRDGRRSELLRYRKLVW